MREITHKIVMQPFYRLWYEGSYWPVASIDYDGSGAIVNVRYGVQIDEDGNFDFPNADLQYAKLERWTGLQDRFGDNIFEGDILIAKDNTKMTVSWEQCYASFCLKNPNWAFNHFFGEAVDAGVCEIIGNINQNSDEMETF
jgi:hypothetical protein